MELILAKIFSNAIGGEDLFCYTSRMKYLGVDYGTKRVGIATSDEGGRMAFPFKVIPNSPNLISEIATICTTEHVAAIVVGESLNFQNMPNAIMDEIHPFATALEKAAKLPLYFMNEILSSREAMHIQGDNKHNDASAAAIILQSYLDKHNPPNEDEHDGEV